MSDLNAVRSASEKYALYYGDIRRHLSSEFAAEVRWRTASLFALNSGGLLAVDRLESAHSLQFVAFGCFWAGIATAFIFTVYSSHKSKAYAAAITILEEQYVLAWARGFLDSTSIEEAEKAKRSVSTKWAPFISISSFIMFTIGVFLVGVGR